MRIKPLVSSVNAVRKIYACASDGGNCDIEDLFSKVKRTRPGDVYGIIDILKRFAKETDPNLKNFIKKIDGEIYEFIKGDIRIFWFEDSGNIVICTNAIVKDSQQTREKDKNKAQKRRDEYYQAKKSGNLIIDEMKKDESSG